MYCLDLDSRIVGIYREFFVLVLRFWLRLLVYVTNNSSVGSLRTCGIVCSILTDS